MGNFCSECGSRIEHEPAAVEAAEEVAEKEVTADVRIAEIQAERDIKLAQIAARVEEHTTDVEQAADLAHAEGKAEGMEAAIAPAETAPSPAAPVVVVDQADEPAADAIPEPPVAEASAMEPAEHKRKSANWWGG
jgi:hypothetical protein